MFSIASARERMVFLTACKSFFIAAFSSRSRVLSAFILPVQLTALSHDALTLHRPHYHALMDSGLLVQSPLGVAAVVDTLLTARLFQITVGNLRPCLAPEYKLLLTVPAFGNEILPPILGAFGVLAGTIIPVLLCFRRRQVNLLFANLVLIDDTVSTETIDVNKYYPIEYEEVLARIKKL